jgi:hypothetical protein
MPGGGFPYQALHDAMRAMGIAVPSAPSVDASGMNAMRDLWTGAGLEEVEARELRVERTFAGFDDYWATVRGGPSVGRQLAAMSSEQLAALASRMRARLRTDPAGRITCSARANAVKGRAAG